MNKLRQYIGSLPMRILLAALVFTGAYAYRHFSGGAPLPRVPTPEGPAPRSHGSGLEAVHQAETERVLQWMADLDTLQRAQAASSPKR